MADYGTTPATCPDCGANVQVDNNTGQVNRHNIPVRGSPARTVGDVMANLPVAAGGNVRAVRERLRADPRVPLVERAFLAQRVGLVGGDVELLRDATVRDLLALPSSVVMTIGAARLLERLDAQLAREHPVDVDHPTPNVAVAHVPFDDDVVFDVVMRDDGRIDLDRDLDPLLSLDEAESLAYALLRLVELARSRRVEPTVESGRSDEVYP